MSVILIGGATVLFLMGVAAAAMIYAMSERRQVTDFRNYTEDRFASVDKEMSGLGAALATLIGDQEVSKGDFATRAPAMLEEEATQAEMKVHPLMAGEMAIVIARRAREMHVRSDPERIATVALRFLRLTEDDPRLAEAYMQSIAELASYRSWLMPNPFGASGGSVTHEVMSAVPKIHSFQPQTLESRVTGYKQTADGYTTGEARLVVLNRSEPLVAGDEQGYRALMVDGYNLILDGLDARNVVFNNCKITCRGGPLALDNVHFVNCTFDLDTTAQDVAAALFQSSVSIQRQTR